MNLVASKTRKYIDLFSRVIPLIIKDLEVFGRREPADKAWECSRISSVEFLSEAQQL